MGKKVAAHIGQVIKGILFIGFSIQIVLGIIWMCSNFAHVQDFGVPESAFYGILFKICGECPQVMYILQLVVAFGVGYIFLQILYPANKWFAVWRGLVLVTFPFAMQMALAIQPYSLMGSLFLLILYFLLKGSSDRKVRLTAVVVCLLLFIGLSGVMDADREEKVWGHGWEASLASRMGWPTIWHDMEAWSDELREITSDVVWVARYCPDNMQLLIDAIEDGADEEKAKEYYREIVDVGWAYHWPMIVRQVGWDVLGYTITPIIMPFQLAGEAYDSYTCGNYRIMQEHTPALTSCYIRYGCWWFACSLGLTVVLSVLGIISSCSVVNKNSVRRLLFGLVICCGAAGILVVLLTMRGAGLMDYRWTVAVNQLWLIWGLLLMRRDGSTK